jgi:hypothetical protein
MPPLRFAVRAWAGSAATAADARGVADRFGVARRFHPEHLEELR